MALKMKVVTPHGISLEEAYFKIDYFACQPNGDIIFTGNFYANQNARNNGMMNITDISFASGTNTIDVNGNIKAQIYEFIKLEASKIDNPAYSEVNMSYFIFKDAIDC